MSETEGDDFLALMDRIVSKQTGKVFPMPMRSKTLNRAFLGKTDSFFPLEISKISILPQIFMDGERADLPPLCKPFIKLEDALSTLLLKINPCELTKDSMPEFEEVNGVWQRVYNGFCSGDYPIDVKKQLNRKFVGILPLFIFVSVFIDSALMNSGHTRSATPIVLTVLNDAKKNSTLVGFCAKSLNISNEELDVILEKKGMKAKTTRSEVKKLAIRQANWDFCYNIVGSFQERQDISNGFDVQIGIGPSAEHHKVFFVFTNCIGDHPQVHEMTGIKTNACHVCVNMHPFNFAVSDYNRDGVGTFNYVHEFF
jgi:hypothetical protein